MIEKTFSFLKFKQITFIFEWNQILMDQTFLCPVIIIALKTLLKKSLALYRVVTVFRILSIFLIFIEHTGGNFLSCKASDTFMYNI